MQVYVVIKNMYLQWSFPTKTVLWKNVQHYISKWSDFGFEILLVTSAETQVVSDELNHSVFDQTTSVLRPFKRSHSLQSTIFTQ